MCDESFLGCWYFPLLRFFSAQVLRISCPCGCLTLLILVSVCGSRLSLAAGCCCCLRGGCLFPPSEQIKFWLTRRDDTGGLSDPEQAAPLPSGRLPHMGNWLLLLRLLLLRRLLACCPLMSACRYLSLSFILTGSFMLISTTVKLKVCRIKI